MVQRRNFWPVVIVAIGVAVLASASRCKTTSGCTATGTDPTTRVDSTAAGPRLDRIVIGVIIGTVGVGWLLDEAGASVHWRMLPAATLVLIGCALLVSFSAPGQGVLIGVGIAATVLAVAVGVGVNRYPGPAGDRLITPAAADWPVDSQVSVGNVSVDLTRYELPEEGTCRSTSGGRPTPDPPGVEPPHRS